MKVTTDPYTLVELLDKHGHVIGKATTDGNGNATIKPTTPIPEGDVTVRATDNAQHPNSSLSKPVKATLAHNDKAHKDGRNTRNTNQKDSKHNSGNTGDQGDNLRGYNQNDSNQNTVGSLPNTGYNNSESSTAFLMTSLLSGIALLS